MRQVNFSIYQLGIVIEFCLFTLLMRLLQDCMMKHGNVDHGWRWMFGSKLFHQQFLSGCYLLFLKARAHLGTTG